MKLMGVPYYYRASSVVATLTISATVPKSTRLRIAGAILRATISAGLPCAIVSSCSKSTTKMSSEMPPEGGNRKSCMFAFSAGLSDRQQEVVLLRRPRLLAVEPRANHYTLPEPLSRFFQVPKSLGDFIKRRSFPVVFPLTCDLHGYSLPHRCWPCGQPLSFINRGTENPKSGLTIQLRGSASHCFTRTANLSRKALEQWPGARGTETLLVLDPMGQAGYCNRGPHLLGD